LILRVFSIPLSCMPAVEAPVLPYSYGLLLGVDKAITAPRI
jgi:hypothetical protein